MRHIRSWFRFGLRMPLLLIAVLSVICASIEREARTTRRCVAEITRLGGGVLFDFFVEPSRQSSI